MKKISGLIRNNLQGSFVVVACYNFVLNRFRISAFSNVFCSTFMTSVTSTSSPMDLGGITSVSKCYLKWKMPTEIRNKPP